MEPARTIRIRVDQDQARLLGLSSQQLALSLVAVVSGVTATQMRSGIYLVDVLVRASAEQCMSLPTIRTLQVPPPNGRMVPYRGMRLWPSTQLSSARCRLLWEPW